MNILQHQYDLIYSYFKTTTESFDYIDWDGKELLLFQNGNLIERYCYNDLKELIECL